MRYSKWAINSKVFDFFASTQSLETYKFLWYYPPDKPVQHYGQSRRQTWSNLHCNEQWIFVARKSVLLLRLDFCFFCSQIEIAFSVSVLRLVMPRTPLCLADSLWRYLVNPVPSYQNNKLNTSRASPEKKIIFANFFYLCYYNVYFQ